MDNKIFDFDDAMERVGDEELLYELLDDFLNFVDDIQEQLDNAIKVGDSNAVRTAGHTLKGTAANLSITNLSNIGLEFETAGKNSLTDSYESLYDKLVDNINEFKKYKQENLKN